MRRKFIGSLGLSALMVAAVALPACGDDDGGNNDLSLGELEVAYMTAYCEVAMDCANEPFVAMLDGDVDTCLDYLSLQEDFGLTTLVASVNAGNTTYDGAAARQCYNALQSAGCDAFASESPDPACDEVFSGVLEAQASCNLDEECAGGWCNMNGSCPGVCDTRAALTESCANYRPCENGLVCENDVCIADPGPLTAGSPCADSERDCAYGTYCDWEGTGNCTATVGVGQTCYDNEMCRAGLYCDGDGLCAEVTVVSTAGSACGGYDEAPFCSLADGLGCVADYSTGEPMYTTCEPLRQLNEDCVELDMQTEAVTMIPCDMLAGLYCDIDEQNMTGVCLAKKAGGVVCVDDEECLSDYCDMSGHCYQSTGPCDG